MRCHYPFYAVNISGERSVIESYDQAKALINGVSRALTKGCWSREEAEITESPSCVRPWVQNKQSSSDSELPPTSALPTLRTAVATRVTLPLRPAGSVSAASSQSANDDELREAKKVKKRELAALNDNHLSLTEDDPLPAIWNDDRGRPPKARAADLEQSTMTPPPSSQETPPSTSPEAPTSSSQATPKKPRGRPPKAQVADHLKQPSMHAFTIKQSTSTIVEPTPSSTATMPDDSSTEKPHSPSGTATAKAIHDEDLHEQVVVVRAGKRKSDSPLQPSSMTSMWPKKRREASEEVTESVVSLRNPFYSSRTPDKSMPTHLSSTQKRSDPANAVCGTAWGRGTPGGSRQMSPGPSHARVEGWRGIGPFRGVACLRQPPLPLLT